MTRNAKTMSITAAALTALTIFSGTALAQKGEPGRLETEIKEAVGVSVHFTGSTATVVDAQASTLERVIKTMNAVKTFTIVVESGSAADAASRDVASNRGQAVKAYVVAHGVDDTRVRVAVLGPTDPCPTGGAACTPPRGTVRIAAEHFNMVVAK